MPSTQLRQEVLRRARRLVIKVGSQLLTREGGGADTAFMRRIAGQIGDLLDAGYEITLVSSGSISVGCQALDLARRPKDIGRLQAVAAVGQSGLMNGWHASFRRQGLAAAQMLLTRDDFQDRGRYLNISNCLSALHQIGAVPVVNENDTVSVDEISLGDNDILAALVTNAICADALVLLTVVDGLHDERKQLLDLVEDPATARNLVATGRSPWGSGGMQTKLEAARMVTEAGEIAVVANGRERNVLKRIAEGEKLGTIFVPAKRKLAARQRWIGHAVRPSGQITVDAGAAQAVVQKHKSLLATGIVEVVGRFAKGDVVVVRNEDGREIARGLINFDCDETRKIMGKKSSQFAGLLHHGTYQEVIHRDHLVVTTGS